MPKVLGKKYRIEFTISVLKELNHRLTTEKDLRILQRLKWLDLERRNYTQKEICKELHISQPTIWRLAKLFNEKGFEGLTNKYFKKDRQTRSSDVI